MGTRKTLKMSNFDLKKYLAENKLLEEDLTSRAMSVIDSYKGKINGIKNYMRHLGNIPPSISDEDISKEIQKIIDNLGYSDVEESLKIDLENLSLAENKPLKELNMVDFHNHIEREAFLAGWDSYEENENAEDAYQKYKAKIDASQEEPKSYAKGGESDFDRPSGF